MTVRKAKDEITFDHVPLFESISQADLSVMLTCLGSYERSFAKGEVVILEEENVQFIGIVLSGIVNMLKEDIWGNQTLLTYMEPGELIGETFAVQKEARSYTTFVAATDCKLIFLPAQNIICNCPNQCAFHTQLTQNMFDLLGKKGMRLMEKIEISSKATLREKILAYLSLLAQKQNSRYLHVPLNRTQLADYLGSNRSAMTREMSAMRDEGIIDFDKDTFVIK